MSWIVLLLSQLVLIGIGVIAESSAMQWAGFLMFVLGFLAWAKSFNENNKKFTTAQAAIDYLKTIND